MQATRSCENPEWTSSSVCSSRTSSCTQSFFRQARPLHKSGEANIETAAQAAEALGPLAGDAAGALFALGVIGVGFLAVPIMTTGAAYDLCQVMGWKSSLHARPKQATHFYVATAAFTAIAIALNFLGFNPMKALV